MARASHERDGFVATCGSSMGGGLYSLFFLFVLYSPRENTALFFPLLPPTRRSGYPQGQRLGVWEAVTGLPSRVFGISHPGSRSWAPHDPEEGKANLFFFGPSAFAPIPGVS